MTFAGFWTVTNWWSYLQERSGLPGPRANLGLMLEFARGADDDDILQAAESEDEYIRCCGIVGLGFILVRSRDKAVLNSLTEATTSASWRAREAAAMAVQAIGDTDPGIVPGDHRAVGTLGPSFDAARSDCRDLRATVAEGQDQRCVGRPGVPRRYRVDRLATS